MMKRFGRWLIEVGAHLAGFWYIHYPDGDADYLLLTSYEVTGVVIHRKGETIQ